MIEERRQDDKFSPEVRKYIDAAAKAGAKEAFLMLAFEISRAGLKKVAYAVGIAVVSFLSALTAWFVSHIGGGPK